MCAQPPDSNQYAKLAKALRDPDEARATAALETLVHDVVPSIVRQLRPRFRTLGKHDWEDIVQEGLHRIWGLRTSIDPSRFSRGYLYHVLRNAAFDWVRSRRSQVAANWESLQPEHQPTQVPWPRPSSLTRDVEQILGHFSSVDRAILRAFAEAGGKGNWASRVAEELDLRPGTVRVRKLRIMQRVRKALEALGYEGLDEAS